MKKAKTKQEPLHPDATSNDEEITTMKTDADLEAYTSAMGLVKLPPDQEQATKSMSREEARVFVDMYLQAMEKRIAVGNQISSLERRNKDLRPSLLTWYAKNTRAQEAYVNTVLKHWVEAHPVGRWAMQFLGIGHGIPAALLAHIDPEKAVTAGDVYSICGVNPSQVWLGAKKADAWVAAQTGTPEEILAKAAHEFHRNYESMLRYASTDATGKKVKLTRERIAKTLSLRPWNARLKTVVFYIGSSFVRVKGRPNASGYSRLYEERKARETANNERGVYAEQARAILAERPDHKMKAFYKKGQLPPGHIHMRCLRYVAKQFLADFQQELYRHHFHKEPPAPYPIAILGHAHVRRFPDQKPPMGQLPALGSSAA